MHQLIERLHGSCVQVLCQVSYTVLEVFVALVEEVLLCATLAIVARRDKQRKVVFDVA